MLVLAEITSDSSLREVRRYLPFNYSAADVDGKIVVFGLDNQGWAWYDYVLPRLQSGLIAVRPIDDAEEYRRLERAVLLKAIAEYGE